MKKTFFQEEYDRYFVSKDYNIWYTTCMDFYLTNIFVTQEINADISFLQIQNISVTSAYACVV